MLNIHLFIGSSLGSDEFIKVSPYICLYVQCVLRDDQLTFEFDRGSLRPVSVQSQKYPMSTYALSQSKQAAFRPPKTADRWVLLHMKGEPRGGWNSRDSYLQALRCAYENMAIQYYCNGIAVPGGFQACNFVTATSFVVLVAPLIL
jgi:hypothetical protein